MHGGGDPERIWAAHPLSAEAEDDAANAVLAGFAGFMIARSLEPVPPLLPTIRQFQRAQGLVALDWLRGWLGWP